MIHRRTVNEPARLETRAGGQRRIVGYAARFYDGSPGTEFRLWDDIVERILPTAFDRALRDGDDVRALFNHQPDNLLGRVSAGTLELRTDELGLRYEIPLDERDPDHVRVARKLERGDLDGSSFKFGVLPEGERYRREGDRTVREIVNVAELVDVGPVTFPAYEATGSDVRADELAEIRSKVVLAGLPAMIRARIVELEVDQARRRL